MDNTRTIKRALISVYDKDLILDIANELVRVGAEILSTGGTRDYLVSNNIPVTPVEDLTGFPSIFGGRVKTLHPAVMGGILKRRENETDTQEGEKYNIPNIDLVIIDLYPFEDTVAKGATPEEIIEKIDIGGISLIRAAAKNYNDVVIVPSKEGYADILNILKEQDGVTTLAQRRHFAATAFLKSSSYDSHIFQYFNIEENIPAFKVNCSEHRSLRYGENPHQQAMFYGNTEALPEQLHGKELSYN
ncbi:MAG: bifunctional phosphoribosylaminoimidazolecarboxamide formyltransferase/IMP cyclohydrolase PurH, partial [Bacteroidales bacterium]|nr:bifunctional phosphoribosylaminoimidazolecarboxamide formyltransferase/IMP cyclohydrolase PurH [Bacteroidales bacterium]